MLKPVHVIYTRIFSYNQINNNIWNQRSVRLDKNGSCMNALIECGYTRVAA